VRFEELRQSLGHTLKAIETLPADKHVDTGDKEWTTTKLLRRLAWHERSELVVMKDLLARLDTLRASGVELQRRMPTRHGAAAGEMKRRSRPSRRRGPDEEPG